jgi:hypothetical protein
MKEFTPEQFNEFVRETIPCSLFHIMPTDIDDETGVRRDELILLQCLNDYPEALRYKSLSWFVEYFIINS